MRLAAHAARPAGCESGICPRCSRPLVPPSPRPANYDVLLSALRCPSPRTLPQCASPPHAHGHAQIPGAPPPKQPGKKTRRRNRKKKDGEGGGDEDDDDEGDDAAGPAPAPAAAPAAPAAPAAVAAAPAEVRCARAERCRAPPAGPHSLRRLPHVSGPGGSRWCAVRSARGGARPHGFPADVLNRHAHSLSPHALPQPSALAPSARSSSRSTGSRSAPPAARRWTPTSRPSWRPSSSCARSLRSCRITDWPPAA